MSGVKIEENKKRRASTIFEVEDETLQETSAPAVTKLRPELLGVPLVDHDLPGDETFVVVARRFGKQIVYRFSKEKSLYLFSPRSSLRQFVVFVTTNQYFQLFILLLIVSNCILLTFNNAPEEVEYVFAALYTTEMILKIIAKGFCLHKFAYLRDPWNWLDFVVVLLGYLTMAPSVANFSGIRTFRVLRALRTISVIEGLRTMVNAFLRSMRMLTDVLALSLFFISIFALIGMQLFLGVLRNKCVLTPALNVADFHEYIANESNWLLMNGDPVVCGNISTARSCPSNYTCYPEVADNPNHGYTNFDTFPWAFLCTIQLVTADYWENVYEYIIASNGFWSVFYFLMVIFFGSFYILNLILAVVALSYQQEVANLKNQEAGYNQLKETSSSYSIHASFEPQKLFPTKPSTTTSKWSSLLLRYTKTTPFHDNQVGSSGPYYPSSSDERTVPTQSPLFLDKVTPYSFDNESVVSVYNYEPEDVSGTGSGAFLNKGLCTSYGEGISFGQRKDGTDLENPKLHFQLSNPVKDHVDTNGLENLKGSKPSTGQGMINSCRDAISNIEDSNNVTSFDGTEEIENFANDFANTVVSQNADSRNRAGKNFSRGKVSNTKQKRTKQNLRKETRAESANKIPYENSISKRNLSSYKSKKGNLDNFKGHATVQDMSKTEKLNLDGDPDKSPVPKIVITDHLEDKHMNISNEKNPESEILCLNEDLESVGNSNSALKYHEKYPEKTENRKSCRSTVTAKSVAWKEDARNRLSIDQGLMLVQTSSVCVIIPRATAMRGLNGPVNELRRKCAAVIMNPMFDWFITSVIFVNTLVMAMEYHRMNSKLEDILDKINLACALVFIIEMFIKVTGFTLRGYIQSRWNLMDGFIVVMSVVEMIIVWCVPDVTHGLGFTVLRTFRLIRILKLAQSWVTMRALISTIAASIGQLGNLTLLLAIVTYTFAVVGMQLFSKSFTADHFEDGVVPRWNFSDFLHSFMIIFRVLCGEWIEPLVMTMHVTTPAAVVFYFAVLIIGNFLILNLFLALLLNSFSTESLSNCAQAKQSVNIRERFCRIVRKYVMRVLRPFRVSAKAWESEHAGGNSSQSCDKDAIGTQECNWTNNDILSSKNPTTSKSGAIDQSCIRPASRDTFMTPSKHSQKTFCHHDVVAPDCLPRFCCRCYNREKGDRSIGYTVVVFSRAKVLNVVKHKYFDAFILFIIFISSVSLALEDVHLDSKPDLKAFLNILNYVVTVIFASEFVLKLFGLGLHQYFRNAWNCMDFFIVVVSVMSLHGSVGDGNLTAFRSLRTLRALRPLRAIPRWQGMKVVVNSLFSAIPEIGNVSLVCLIFWLIFSVMGVQFFGGKFYKCVDASGEVLHHTTVANKANCLALNYTWTNSDINFDNSLAGFLALFQVATFEGWIEIIADATDVTGVDKQPIRDKNHISYLYFVVFVLFGSFFVLNLFVGVIIDNFNRLKKDHESGAVGLFLTESQRAWYDTLRKAASKKPKKVAKRPKEKWRACLFDIVNSSKFEFAIMILIMLNMVIMMMRHHGQSEAFTSIILYSNLVFTAIFCLEAVLRLCVQHLDYFMEPWNVFDFIIVLLSISGLLMEFLNHAFMINPSIFRVVRVFRVGRLLRFYKNVGGIRRLLFALLISLPALVNIGALLFLLLFIYAIIGMSTFGYVKHSGAINDMVNFETFRNSMLLLFRLSTSAGWNDILASLMIQTPNCDPTHDDLPNGNCGNPYFAIFYFVSFVLITSLIIINMYIAVILENLHEAYNAETAGITDDDLDMFYQKWELFDPLATQYIPHGLLSDFVDSLEMPLRLPKPNKFACINLHIPIQQGDRIHCVDVLQALVRHLIGDIKQQNPDVFMLMQKKLEEAFLAAFPNRAKQRTETTTFVRNREIYAALVIQKAWRAKVSNRRASRQIVC